MGPPISEFEKFVNSSQLPREQSLKESFNYIHDFMINSKNKVDDIQQKRIKSGEISDKKQSGKSIAGHMFQYLVIYIFILNKQIGNLPNKIYITNKKKGISNTNKDLIIDIGKETQKPDCDIIIYNNENNKSMVISLKTSLRERAGQTVKWKLMLDIATSNDTYLKNKYDISYQGKDIPLMCFATVNFYNEINKPQQRGMLRFFDSTFIAKPNVNSEFINNMSTILDFISENMT